MKKQTTRFIFITLCILLCFSVLFGCVDEGDKTPECTEHSFGDWEEVVDPSEPHECQDKEYERTCSVCGEKEEKGGSEEDHLWELKWGIKPTCKRGGYDIYVCSICNKEKGVDLPIKNDHTLGDEYETTADEHYKICSVCDKAIGTEKHIYEDDKCTVCHTFKEYYEISMWVQNGYMGTNLFAKQIKEFADANKVTIKLTASEKDGVVAGNDIMNDPSCAPDIFCFTQSELQGLIDAEAIMPLSDAEAEQIKATHCYGAALASSENGVLYGYPLAITERVSILYYDKSLISEDDAKSLEKIIDICEKNNKFFRFQLSSGWGVEFFFRSTGCQSSWTVNKDFEFVALDDNYNSDAGIAAMKAIAKLASSPAFNNDAYSHNYGNDTPIIISELGNRWIAQNTFGENLGITILPSFTVDGESYQMKSVGSTFLLGISPTEDSKKAELLSRLALWLIDEKCQLERYDLFEWCPTNLAAQASERVKSNPYHQIQIQQYNMSVPERHKNSYWYYIAGDLYLAAKDAKTDEEIIAALNRYDERVNLLFEKGEYQ